VGKIIKTMGFSASEFRMTKTNRMLDGTSTLSNLDVMWIEFS
jgi:hypothetical protein